MTGTSGPTVVERLRCLPQYVIPQKGLTGLVHWFTRRRSPVWLKNWTIRRFVAAFGVDLTESAITDPADFRDFNAFFTRELRPGARSVDADAEALACPVDGTVSQCGSIERDRVYQAKGRDFSLRALLGGGPEAAEPFADGLFATLYLSPKDYHRIHMPCDATLRETVHIPGRLFSVSPLTTRVVPRLFARNERLVCRFDTTLGPMAVVLVGAVNVASIETVWAGVVTPPFGRQINTRHFPENGVEGCVFLRKGEELGRFNMGSTVIVVLPADKAALDGDIQPGAAVQMGQRLTTRSG